MAASTRKTLSPAFHLLLNQLHALQDAVDEKASLITKEYATEIEDNLKKINEEFETIKEKDEKEFLQSTSEVIKDVLNFYLTCDPLEKQAAQWKKVFLNQKYNLFENCLVNGSKFEELYSRIKPRTDQYFKIFRIFLIKSELTQEQLAAIDNGKFLSQLDIEDVLEFDNIFRHDKTFVKGTLNLEKFFILLSRYKDNLTMLHRLIHVCNHPFHCFQDTVDINPHYLILLHEHTLNYFNQIISDDAFNEEMINRLYKLIEDFNTMAHTFTEKLPTFIEYLGQTVFNKLGVDRKLRDEPLRSQILETTSTEEIPPCFPWRTFGIGPAPFEALCKELAAKKRVSAYGSSSSTTFKAVEVKASKPQEKKSYRCVIL